MQMYYGNNSLGGKLIYLRNNVQKQKGEKKASLQNITAYILF